MITTGSYRLNQQHAMILRAADAALTKLASAHGMRFQCELQVSHTWAMFTPYFDGCNDASVGSSLRVTGSRFDLGEGLVMLPSDDDPFDIQLSGDTTQGRLIQELMAKLPAFVQHVIGCIHAKTTDES